MYGSKTQLIVDADGATVIETRYRGNSQYTITSYCETVKVASDQEILSEFLKHLEFLKAEPTRRDGEFKIFKDNNTGAIDRITKCWSEIVD